MTRQKLNHAFLLAAAGLALSMSVWGGCPAGSPPVQNGTTGLSYPSIQAAINAASQFDTIIVHPRDLQRATSRQQGGVNPAIQQRAVPDLFAALG